MSTHIQQAVIFTPCERDPVSLWNDTFVSVGGHGHSHAHGHSHSQKEKSKEEIKEGTDKHEGDSGLRKRKQSDSKDDTQKVDEKAKKEQEAEG